MYEELVKDLREKAEFLTIAEPLNIKNAFAETMNQAADAIDTMCEMVATAHDELANVIQSCEESKPRWIPASERLPNPYDIVFGWDGCDIGFAAWQRKGRYWLGDENFDDTHPQISHWMPLPEPPKEDETDGLNR